jgi:5-methylcytosine-specific restriction endonuclease McrA
LRVSRECEAPGCVKPVLAKARCRVHYARMAKHGSFDLPVKPPPAICSVDGCSTVVRCKDLCGRHYQRMRTFGTTEYAPTPCAMCGEPFMKSGGGKWCEGCRLAGNREYTRRWRERNAEHVLDYSRRYARANPGKRREWMDVNRAAVQMWTLNRRARIRAATSVRFTSDQLSARWAYYGDRCWLCGAVATATDHVKPLGKGGAHMLCNLRPICKPCNSAKRDRWPLSELGKL